MSSGEKQSLEKSSKLLLKEIENLQEQTILLSSEGFQRVDPQKLEELFPKDRTKIIIYIREQVDYFISCYCQAVHAKNVTFSLEEFGEKVFKANYEKFLQKWASVFGEDRLDVRVFDRKMLINGDIVDDFLNHLGFKNLTSYNFERGNERSNISIGGSLLLFKLFLNGLSFQEDYLREKVYSVFSDLAASDERFRMKPLLDKKNSGYYS